MEECSIYRTPPNPEGREEKEMAVYALLERLKIPYERLDHKAAFSIHDCRDVDRRLGIHLCKNLFLCNAARTEFYLLVMPGEKRFRTREVSAQIGSTRLSFALEEELSAYMNLAPGSVTVMGLVYDKGQRVHLLMDRETAEEEYIACHPCVNTASIKIRTEDLMEKFLHYTGHSCQTVELTGE